MKINLFSFSGPLHNARYLQKKLTELTGKKVNLKESSLKLSETEEIDSGEIRLVAIPTRLLQPVTDLILSMEDNGKTERNLFNEYKETGYFNLPIIHHRSVVCAPPCQSGYIMVRGNACRCYTCKGTGYVMPQVGSYELRKIDKKEI